MFRFVVGSTVQCFEWRIHSRQKCNQDFPKNLTWRAFQQEFTAKGRELFLHAPSYMLAGVLHTLMTDILILTTERLHESQIAK